MTRLELHHQQTRHFSWKVPLALIFSLFIISGGILEFSHYSQQSIKLDVPAPVLGPKVMVQLPNGQKVFTYENLIYEKNGKTFYKGDRNTIDLTGGTIVYQDWKQ